MVEILVMVAVLAVGAFALMVGQFLFALAVLGRPPAAFEGIEFMWWWGDVIPAVPDGARALPVVPYVLTVGLRWV